MAPIGLVNGRKHVQAGSSMVIHACRLPLGRCKSSLWSESSTRFRTENVRFLCRTPCLCDPLAKSLITVAFGPRSRRLFGGYGVD